MDSSGEQLHPNWRALATIYLPLKRFVRESSAEHGVGDSALEERHEIRSVTGEEVRQFYDDLVRESTDVAAKIDDKSENRTRRKRRSQPKANQAIPFDRRKYFEYATTNNVNELRKLRLEAEDINACDCFGWTALMMAACEGAEDAVRFLLALRVDRNVRDKAGSTALQLAQKKGHATIISLLQTVDAASLDSPQMLIGGNATAPPAPALYCSTCQSTFTDTTLRQHITSTIHQFETRPSVPTNSLHKFNIPCQHRGLRLMIKQGWNKESGLGPTQSGRLYPVKTVIRKQRTGLGIEQPPARVTHFEAFDVRATQRNASDYYKKKPRTRNDMRRERQFEWKRERRLRNELS